MTVEQAFACIQTDYSIADEARGALKVLVAVPTTDAPRFYPGINLRDYRVEQNVFACAPPAGSHSTDNDDDIWQYSPGVLSGYTSLKLYHVSTQVTTENWLVEGKNATGNAKAVAWSVAVDDMLPICFH